VLGLCAAYTVATRLDLRPTFSRHWRLAVALGVLFGVALVRNVLSEDVTPRPHGAYYVFELIWRGGIYGVMDRLPAGFIPPG
jgi:hypothetical protein